MRTKKIKEKVRPVIGIFRLNIIEDKNGIPKVVGDTGWRENQITNSGKENFLVKALGALAGSSQIAWAAIGTGTAPASTATSLPGEITDAANNRMSVVASDSSPNTLQFTFSLASGIMTAAHTVQNVGLFAVSTTGAGTVFAGNTYFTSSIATNQSIAGTYQIIF
jgi:hypothetical protein